ncbi:MAG: hypothetical protein HYY67_01790 [Thaumarchaeota archaeon]|nr:hypothetical protein [Nitrososphaerota archaeon]
MQSKLRFYSDENFTLPVEPQVDFGRARAGDLARKELFVRNENVFPVELFISAQSKALEISYPGRLEPGESGKIVFAWNVPIDREEPLESKWLLEITWLPRSIE